MDQLCSSLTDADVIDSVAPQRRRGNDVVQKQMLYRRRSPTLKSVFNRNVANTVDCLDKLKPGRQPQSYRLSKANQDPAESVLAFFFF